LHDLCQTIYSWPLLPGGFNTLLDSTTDDEKNGRKNEGNLELAFVNKYDKKYYVKKYK
jgi:hypothetical protein